MLFEDFESGVFPPAGWSQFGTGAGFADTTGAYVYNCVSIIRFVDKILTEEISKLPKKSGRYYGLLIHGNRIMTLIAVQKLALGHELKNQKFKINEKHLDLVTRETIQKVFDYLEKEYSDNMLGTLFKNATKCKDIVQNCV